jgi:hypothetical protein
MVSMLLASMLSSCSSNATNPQKKQFSSQRIPHSSGITKVLNRVECTKDKSYCPQEELNKIWNACLGDGYVVKLPSAQVFASREIRELTERSYQYKYEEEVPREIVEASGVVGTVSTVVGKEGTRTTAKGYCIGSEYITSR